MTQPLFDRKRYEEALDRAARLWGIEPEYGDTWGQVHATAPEIKRAILSARGIDAETVEGLDHAVEERHLRDWDRLLPPVFVVGESAWSQGFPLSVPAGLAHAKATLEIRWDEADTESRELALAGLPNAGRAELRGETYVRKQIPLGANARMGYHHVEVTVHGAKGQERRASMRLILCPDRAYTAPAVEHGNRTAGIAIALYGLRSSRNWGCGDFTDLEGFSEWAASDLGLTFIGVNPLHAIPNRQPFNISPYLPASTFYKNPIYLDLDRIEDFRRSARARRWLAQPETQREIEALRSSAFVEYERVWALKVRGLFLAFAEFLRREWAPGTPRGREFRAFVEQEGALLDRFASYCALDSYIHQRNPDVWIWPQWPEQYREPDSAAVAGFAKKHWRLVLFYKYAQWNVDQQLAHAQEHAKRRGLNIGIFNDLALATDRFGADLWAYRPFFVNGCRVGAPPDTFSPKGQDWSFPPPDSDHHRETGYRLFAESIRKNCRNGGALRIDHVMRFFRLYWIPEGNEPMDGAYVRDYSDELLHILALESVRNKVIVVGEDLGTVTREIRQALDHFGIYGYRVPYFEKDDRGDLKLPDQYSEHALVASSTHDLPTLSGFWLARDVEARRAAGQLSTNGDYHRQLEDRGREKQKFLDALFAKGLLPDWFPRRADQVPEFTGELHNAFTGWVATAPSRMLAINQEDLFKDAEQQNLPATTSEHPNWRRKMRLTVEELNAGAARDYAAMLRNWLAKTGRLAPTS